MDIQRVDYIRVPVRDIEQAKNFYGEVLGLEQNANSPGEETGSSTRPVTSPSRS